MGVYIREGEVRGVLLLRCTYALSHSHTDCMCFCANSNGSNPGHFYWHTVAICSGEGKGIRVRHGKSKGEMASRGRVQCSVVGGLVIGCEG